MMYIVLDESITSGRVTIPAGSDGKTKAYDTLDEAADQIVHLERDYAGWRRDYIKIYRLEPQAAVVPIREARKRAGVVEPEHGAVDRALYEDLVTQNQHLTARVTVLEADNRDLESSYEQYRSSLKQKAIDLDVAYDKLERIGKLAKED